MKAILSLSAMVSMLFLGSHAFGCTINAAQFCNGNRIKPEITQAFRTGILQALKADENTFFGPNTNCQNVSEKTKIAACNLPESLYGEASLVNEYARPGLSGVTCMDLPAEYVQQAIWNYYQDKQDGNLLYFSGTAGDIIQGTAAVIQREICVEKRTSS